LSNEKHEPNDETSEKNAGADGESTGRIRGKGSRSHSRWRCGQSEGKRKKEILSIEIQPEAVDPDDVEMLQDLVTAAVNEALKQVDELVAQSMGKLTGGLNIPGLF